MVYLDDDHINNTSQQQVQKDFSNFNQTQKATGNLGVQKGGRNISWAIRNNLPYQESIVAVENELLQRILVMLHEMPEQLKPFMASSIEPLTAESLSNFGESYRDAVLAAWRASRNRRTAESTRSRARKFLERMKAVCVVLFCFSRKCVVCLSRLKSFEHRRAKRNLHTDVGANIFCVKGYFAGKKKKKKEKQKAVL